MMRTFANVILGYWWKKWVCFDFIAVVYFDFTILMTWKIIYIYMSVWYVYWFWSSVIDHKIVSLLLELAFTSRLIEKCGFTDVRPLNFDCWKMSRILLCRCVLQQKSRFLSCVKMPCVQELHHFLYNHNFAWKKLDLSSQENLKCVSTFIFIFSQGVKTFRKLLSLR